MGSKQNLKVLSTVKSNPKWTMASRTSVHTSNGVTPGPGTYELNNITPMTFKFPKSARVDKQIETTPGPGSYTHKLNTISPLWSMSYRYEKSTAENVLGPGAYTPKNENFLPTHTHTFPKAPRKNLSTHINNPGPGTYSPALAHNSVEYSLAKKLVNESKPNDTPGPGMYTPTFTEGKLKISIAGKNYYTPKNMNYPGPGHYTPKSDIGQGLKKSMGIKYTHTNSVYTPGPGTYQIKPMFGNDTHAHTFGSENRELKSSTIDTPGPSFYTIDTHNSTTPQWKFGTAKRPNNINISDAPGPGSYTPQFNDTVLSINKYVSPTKGTASGPIYSAPGPGYYNINEPKTLTYSFGKEIRIPPKMSKQNTPGPGTYNPLDMNHGPSWSMIGTSHKTNTSDNSGNIGLMISSFE